MELTAASKFTMRPLRDPLDSAAPFPKIWRFRFRYPLSTRRSWHCRYPARPDSALSCPLITPAAGRTMRTHGGRRTNSRFDASRRHRVALRIDHDLPGKSQIDRFHASRTRTPLRDVFRQQTIFVHKVAISKVHPNRILAFQSRQTRQHGANILRVREINFADLFAGTGMRQFNFLHEIDEKGHARLAVNERSGVVETADDRKVKAGLQRALENHARGVHELQFVSCA